MQESHDHGAEIARQQLRELHERMDPEQQTSAVYLGTHLELHEALPEIIRNHKVSLVIMGTQGAGRLSGAIFGTNASWVVQHAPCPVLVVPDTFHAQRLEQVAYATQFDKTDLLALEALGQLMGEVKLTLLHVTSDPGREVEMVKESFAARLQSQLPGSHFEILLLKGRNVADTLHNYLEQHATQLLVMSARPHTAVDRVLGKSLSQLMTQQSRLPLLIFHRPLP